MYTPLGSSGPNSPNSNEPHESITLSACIIHAVNDLAPYPEGAKKDPFMYWDNEDEISAAVALIKRYVIVIVPFLIFVMLCKNVMLRDNNYYTF
jgi:hypothetical protein